MRPLLRTSLFLAALTLSLAPGALAQGAPEPEEDGPGVRFNGYGRSLVQQTGLGGTISDTDTLSVESLSDGEFLLDLAVNAQPNDVTEVQGVIRVRNEFGGFFGSGVTVEVRELWARGIIADVLRYRVGDMDVALTPYTLYLPEADGVINTPALFRPLREVIYYDEFYTGFNERRLQGGKLDFGLQFEQGIEAAEVRAFVARLRATDFFEVPTRFIGGGRVGATSARFGPYDSQAKLGVNLVYTWDDLGSGEANTGIRNSVVSFDGDVTVLDRDAFDLHLIGEGGFSSVERAMDMDDPEEARRSRLSKTTQRSPRTPTRSSRSDCLAHSKAPTSACRRCSSTSGRSSTAARRRASASTTRGPRAFTTASAPAATSRCCAMSRCPASSTPRCRLSPSTPRTP